MANDKDRLFEKIYFLWKGESEKRNQCIDWYCERYGANIEEFRKWLQGINHSVKEIQVVGRPGRAEATKLEAEAAEEAMSRLRKFTPEYNRKMKIQLKIINFLSIFFATSSGGRPKRHTPKLDTYRIRR